MKTASLRAIHDDDLDMLLERLGLTHDLRAGKLTCKICSEPVTRETLQGIFPDSGALRVVCNKPSCVTLLLRSRQA